VSFVVSLINATFVSTVEESSVTSVNTNATTVCTPPYILDVRIDLSMVVAMGITHNIRKDHSAEELNGHHTVEQALLRSQPKICM
jgi:hypothetical protein